MAELTAEKRIQVGRAAARVRREGKIPAVVYGDGVPSMPISVSAREFAEVFEKTGETGLVNLRVQGDGEYNVLIHDVAKDPRTLAPIHADFYAVRMDKPIEAEVALEFTGESPAVKNDGGILVKVLHTLRVKALPKDLPSEIVVDISALGAIDSKLHVQDLELPAGVLPLVAADEVVALVEPPRSDAELEALTKAETPVEAVEVKTEREVKAEEKANKEAISAEGEKATA